MLKIRLSRVGRKNRPLFRLVVAPKSAPAKSGYLKSLGTWDPVKKNLNIDQKELKKWLLKGAKTSNTVHNILVKEKIIKAKKIKISREKPKNKKKEEEGESKDEKERKDIQPEAGKKEKNQTVNKKIDSAKDKSKQDNQAKDKDKKEQK